MDATYHAAIDLLDAALAALEDTEPLPTDPHGLLAVLNTYPGIVVVCRCTDAFPSVATWRVHRDGG